MNRCALFILVLSCLLGFGFCYSYRFPYTDSNEYEDNPKESQYKSTGNGFDTSNYDNKPLFDFHNDDDDSEYKSKGSSSNEDSSNEMEICHYTHYTGYVPKGRTNVDHIKFLGQVNTYQECANLCCDFGRQCQYGWLFNDKCFAVSCSRANRDMCHPVLSSSNGQYKTIVMRMKRLISSSSLSPPISSTSQPIHPIPSTTVAMTTAITTSLVSSNTSSISPQTTKVVSSSSVPSQTSLPTPSSTTHIKLHKSISVGVDSKNKHLTLPKNHIKIFASTWPQPTDDTPFHYRWKKLFGPDEGSFNGLDTNTVSLNNLVVGKYGLQIIVFDNNGNYGTAKVNVTVSPEPHVNQSPHAIISPSDNITIFVNDKLILDASKTTDDGDKSHLVYQWDLVSGPLEGVSDRQDSWDKQVLSLKDLKVGYYIFKLKVSDEQGLSDTKYVHVKVAAVPDYPPTANAGESVLIHLPHDSVILDASKSTDDKGIVKYKWKQIKGNQVEMKGIESKQLHINKLEIGLYQFEVTVTDTIGQEDTSTVTVDVQAENNQPPIAMTTGNVTVWFPSNDAVLNGTLSSDDYKIVSYKWTQFSGPEDIQLIGIDKPVLQVKGLHVKNMSPTVYGFQLSVTDYRNLTTSTAVYIKFHKDENVKPQANAGPDVTITLPQHTAILNGSQSHDGFGIKSYKWIKSSSSPAAGNIVDGSDNTPVLILSDLINGTYNYTLTITNNNGKSSKDTVTLTVKEDPHKLYLVELYLDIDIFKFTNQDMNKLSDDLVLKMGVLHYRVHIQQITSHDQHTLVEFYVTDNGKLVNASHIYNKVTKDGQDFQLGSFRAIRVEEGICQNPCSYHGYCDVRTKRCVCSTFWMENPFTAHFGSRHSNCDWSVLYVVLVIVGVVIIVCLCVWLCCCCCIHSRRQSRKRRIKYAILDHNKEDGRVRMLSRDGMGRNKNSLMVSETETEEEILFDTSSKKGKQQLEKQSLIPPNNTIKNNLSDRNKNINSMS